MSGNFILLFYYTALNRLKMAILDILFDYINIII
jgi:hypothetical protein